MHKTYEDKLPIYDKLAHLQNALKLEERTAKQIRKEAVGSGKSNFKEIKKLESDNMKNRRNFKIYMSGDTEKKQIAMRNNKFYQIAYQQKPTNEAAENIEERLFIMRKESDKLCHERKKLENTLHNLKLELQDLSDPEKLMPISYKEQEVVNRIQNMLTKQNAARIVNEAYERLFNMLDKESLKFDKTLKNMESDRITQAKCILRATETGQEASHRLAELHDSYKLEERKLRKLMKKMDTISRNLKTELESVSASCKEFGRESVDRLSIGSGDEDDLGDAIKTVNQEQELMVLENSLETLKRATEVPAFDDIYPRIVQQYKTKEILSNMVQFQDNFSENLLDHYNKLLSLSESLENTLIPSTGRIERSRLTLKMEQTVEEQKNAQKVREYFGEFLLDIRTSLITLSRKLDRIDRMSKYESDLFEQENPCVSEHLETLTSPETDPRFVLDNVNMKMLMMVDRFKQIDIPLTDVNGQYLRAKGKLEEQIMLSNATEVVEPEYEHAMTELLQDLLEVEDPSVPTRTDIKKQSARIVRLMGSDE